MTDQVHVYGWMVTVTGPGKVLPTTYYVVSSNRQDAMLQARALAGYSDWADIAKRRVGVRVDTIQQLTRIM